MALWHDGGIDQEQQLFIRSPAMASSLHVSLPDEMQAYVDLRTNGKNA
jgi:hypothetical protein